MKLGAKQAFNLFFVFLGLIMYLFWISLAMYAGIATGIVGICIGYLIWSGGGRLNTMQIEGFDFYSMFIFIIGLGTAFYVIYSMSQFALAVGEIFGYFAAIFMLGGWNFNSFNHWKEKTGFKFEGEK